MDSFRESEFCFLLKRFKNENQNSVQQKLRNVDAKSKSSLDENLRILLKQKKVFTYKKLHNIKTVILKGKKNFFD